MTADEWTQLLVERRAAPARLTDAEFRAWMEGRPIFVSSPLDDEMKPFREAARATILRLGGEPVLWESITPRDQRAEDAFLEGVDRSSLLLLIVGSRYGVADESGYSATHKEVIRAGERGIPRLLFELGGISPSDRDGKLNDWIRSIHNEVSTAQAVDAEELATKIEARLSELAAAQERTWLKLGRLVFPGQVERATSQGGSTLTVTASILEPALRRELNDVAGSPHRAGDRLTWGMNSEDVNVRVIDMRSATASRDDVKITCESSHGYRSMTQTILHGTISTGGRSYGSADQIQIWVEEHVLGRKVPSIPDAVRSFFGGERASLPDILAAYTATGWVAEGISRLFIVESLLAKFGGYFDRLEVGPATADGVRISLAHVSGSDDVAHAAGLVPLRP